jgi:hypothetical protein
MDLPAAPSRRDLLLLLVASAMGRLPSANGPPVVAAATLSDEFVIVDGWVLPLELFARA